MLYPIIGLVYGASALASNVITDIYASNATDGANDIMGQIVGAGILVLPLFIVPGILKKALDGVGGIGGKLSAFGAKMGGKARSGVKGSEFAKHQANRLNQRRALIKSGNYEGRSPLSRLRSGANKRINKSGAYNSATGGYGNKRSNADKKLEEEEVQRQIENLAGASDASGNAIDPRTSFDAALAERRAAHAKPQGTKEEIKARNAAIRSSNISVRAAQRHLTNTLGKEGADYAKAALFPGGTSGGAAPAGGGTAGGSAGGTGGGTGGASGGAAPGGGAGAGTSGPRTSRTPPIQAVPNATAQARAQAASGSPSQSGGPVASGNGQYRQNSSGQDIRPAGSTGSGGAGAYISASEKQQIDAHASSLNASQKAYDDAIAGGLSPVEAQAIGGNVFQVHSSSSGGSGGSSTPPPPPAGPTGTPPTGTP